MRYRFALFFIFCVPLLLGACATAPVPTPTATETAAPTATSTVALPTETPTQTLTPTSSPTRTSTPKPTALPTRRRTSPATATASLTAGPSPTPSAAQVCATLTARGTGDIYVVYIHPQPDLVWDKAPRQFLVGLCDTLPAPNTPQGKYKIVLNFPAGNGSLTQSAPVPAELKSGLNEISIGPWIPGLENHLAICAQRAVAETQVMYDDTPGPYFRALLWADGSDRVPLPIRCGGNYS